MTEREEAFKLADKILDKTYIDPDGDICLLARQLIRISQGAKSALEMQIKYCSNGQIHTDAKNFLATLLPAPEQEQKP